MRDFDDTNFTGDLNYNYSDDPATAGMMESYNPSHHKVATLYETEPERVWTIIDGECGNLIIMKGMQVWGAFMYFVSNEKWNNKTDAEYIWCISGD